MNKILSVGTTSALVSYLKKSPYKTSYLPEKHRLVLIDSSENEILQLRLPIQMQPDDMQLMRVSSASFNYVILLIQAGNCALGLFEGERNVDHKVFRAYMVRKKQGKSQIKYLKTKGKSRAGSRVRLGEGVEFFENINERLQFYFQEQEIHRIAISCSKTLIPFLYNAKVETPFEKKDPRILKIPKHVHTPIYEVLLETNSYLRKGELIFEETQQAFVEGLLLELSLDEEEDLE